MIQVILYICFTLSTVIEAQDCTGIPDSNTLRIKLQNDVIRSAPGEGSTTVALANSTNVCQAQGSTKGTYRELSFVMEYITNSNPNVQRHYFNLVCIDAGGGNIGYLPSVSLPSQLRTAPADYTTIQLRTDCNSCTNTGDENSCTTCPAACSDGLMRCTGNSDSDCCIAFEEDGMCTNTNCTSTNFVANEQNDFTCACKFNNETCGSGFLFNATNCSCTLTNICMTTPSPCNNGGTCTLLNSTPDNFTCNCTGTGFTGPNCSEPVVMKMSSSIAMTMSQVTSNFSPSTSSTTTTTMSMSKTTTTNQDSATVPTSSAKRKPSQVGVPDTSSNFNASNEIAFSFVGLISILILLIVFAIVSTLCIMSHRKRKKVTNSQHQIYTSNVTYDIISCKEDINGDILIVPVDKNRASDVIQTHNQ